MHSVCVSRRDEEFTQKRGISINSILPSRCVHFSHSQAAPFSSLSSLPRHPSIPSIHPIIMSQTVYSKGILHGLPTFPDHDDKRYSIIVTGANGISGTAMLKVLSENPSRWDKIYALSRRPPQHPDNEHIIPLAVDFLDSTPSRSRKSSKITTSTPTTSTSPPTCSPHRSRAPASGPTPTR